MIKIHLNYLMAWISIYWQLILFLQYPSIRFLKYFLIASKTLEFRILLLHYFYLILNFHFQIWNLRDHLSFNDYFWVGEEGKKNLMEEEGLWKISSVQLIKIFYFYISCQLYFSKAKCLNKIWLHKRISYLKYVIEVI